MLQRRFHYNQDYTKKSVDGKKSFNNDIYYCSDGVGIHIFCVYSHDTPNEYGKNERWRGKREKKGKSHKSSFLRVSSEKGNVIGVNLPGVSLSRYY
jgi:hypothetical protein